MDLFFAFGKSISAGTLEGRRLRRRLGRGRGVVGCVGGVGAIAWISPGTTGSCEVISTEPPGDRFSSDLRARTTKHDFVCFFLWDNPAGFWYSSALAVFWFAASR